MKRVVTTAFLVFSVAGCFGCGRSNPEAPPPRDVAVVLGGSIAEGHPALHGLHHGQSENLPGQISYYVEQATGMRVLNQGIGGQTCTEIVARWTQDVPKDAKLVWLACGQNDLLRSREPVESIRQAILTAKALADESGIRLIVQNLGPNASRHGAIAEVNAWLETLGLTVVDFHSWASANRRLFADYLHPTREGYEAFMLAEGLKALADFGRD